MDSGLKHIDFVGVQVHSFWALRFIFAWASRFKCWEFSVRTFHGFQVCRFLGFKIHGCLGLKVE
jgi:hypothetical protein